MKFIYFADNWILNIEVYYSEPELLHLCRTKLQRYACRIIIEISLSNSICWVHLQIWKKMIVSCFILVQGWRFSVVSLSHCVNVFYYSHFLEFVYLFLSNMNFNVNFLISLRKLLFIAGFIQFPHNFFIFYEIGFLLVPNFSFSLCW